MGIAQKFTKKTLYLFAFTTLSLATGCNSIQTGNPNLADTDTSKELFRLENGMVVYSDEFEYAYQKNNFNNDSANTKKDIEQYLDLYIIFKQKVQAAHNLGMDTTSAFLAEFNSYKESLANSYINSADITEKLIQEAYDRYKEEISAAHILIRILDETDTLDAYRKIDSIRQLAVNGGDFAVLASTYSEDPSASKNGGDLGYFTSMQMVYPFECAAYNTPVGEISPIVKTRFGYHILHVKGRRASQGKISVSHIMIRTTADDNTEKQEISRNKIFEIHDQLNNGVAWGQLCEQFSEDENTKNDSGKLRPFATGQMPPTFAQAAFGLQQKGQYSDPVMTPFGWHIVRLDHLLPLENYEKMKPVIKNHISGDKRLSITRQALVRKLKVENGFIEYAGAKSLFDKPDSTLLTGKWTYNTSSEDTLTLFRIGNENFTRESGYEYLATRQRPVRGKTINSYATQLYNKYVEESLIQYEKDHLAEKNAAYKMLVKEYWEGILLFNLMNEKVWEKAVEDTVGLNTYFERNQSKYRWESRANATIYDASSEEITDEIAVMLSQADTIASKREVLLKKYNASSDLNLKIEEGFFEKGDHEVLKLIEWQVGVQKMDQEERFYLIDVKNIIPWQGKKLKECKGIVIADYQAALEKEWVKSLKEKYPVAIHKSVWNHILTKLEK